MTDIETLRQFCLSLPQTSEDMAFGEDHLLFRVCGKIFACLNLIQPNRLAVKCDSDYAIELRDRHMEIEPAWHWNKKYWNQINLNGNLPTTFIQSLVIHSYNEVVKKMPKSQKIKFPEITQITQ